MVDNEQVGEEILFKFLLFCVCVGYFVCVLVVL